MREDDRRENHQNRRENSTEHQEGTKSFQWHPANRFDRQHYVIVDSDQSIFPLNARTHAFNNKQVNEGAFKEYKN